MVIIYIYILHEYLTSIRNTLNIILYDRYTSCISILNCNIYWLLDLLTVYYKKSTLQLI